MRNFIFIIGNFLGENPSDAASEWNVGSGRPLGRRLGANPALDDYATAPASANATTPATTATPFEPTATTTTSGHATVTAASVTPPISAPTTAAAAATTTTFEPQPEAAAAATTTTTSSSDWRLFEFSFEPAH